MDFDSLPFDREFELGDEEDDNLYEAIEVLLADEDDVSHNSESKSSESIAASGEIGKATKKRTTSNRLPKKRKLNPDAATIADCTEAALKELEIDPESEDAKKMRRQIRNRLSAQFHRDRKNMYIKTLEDKVAEKEKEIDSLKAEVAQLKKENELLKAHHDSSDSSYQGMTDSDTPTHSPPHEPTSIMSTFMTRDYPKSTYIVSPNGPPYPSIMGAPLIKSLSVLSVICLLCLTGLAPNGVLIGDGSKVITKQSVIDSGIMDELLSYREGNRRLLAMEDLENPVELTHHLTAKLMLPVTNGSYAPLVDTPIMDQPKYHLRRAVDTNLSFNSSLALPSVMEQGLSYSHKAIFVSKDLIHFDTTGHNYKHGWFADHKVDSLSYSHIVMNKGVAVFDPSLQLGNGPLALQTPTTHAFPVIQTTPMKSDQVSPVRSVPTLSFPHTGLLAAPPSDNDKAIPMDVDDENSPHQHDDSKGLVATKHWPVVSSSSISPNSVQRHHKVDLHNSFPGSPVSAACEAEKQALLNQLLSKSNLVTVTLPASSVRMGKSLSESKDSTVESIMQLFNLTALNGDDSIVGSNSTADASIEINCILLGAKMVVNTASK